VGQELELLCGAALSMLSQNGRRHSHTPMVSQSAKEVFILGVTHQGKPFRPSDWAERLAGVMSQFRPGGPQPGSHLGYSPWCVPTSFGQVKCVIVHRDLRDHDVMAWDFCLNFAKDNDLQLSETRPEVSGRSA
jgi:hypothetical protein